MGVGDEVVDLVFRINGPKKLCLVSHVGPFSHARGLREQNSGVTFFADMVRRNKVSIFLRV